MTFLGNLFLSKTLKNELDWRAFLDFGTASQVLLVSFRFL